MSHVSFFYSFKTIVILREMYGHNESGYRNITQRRTIMDPDIWTSEISKKVGPAGLEPATRGL